MPESPQGRAPSARPATATAENGVVLFDGPQGAIASLTPEAAQATSENLRRAADQAVRQRHRTPVPLLPKA